MTKNQEFVLTNRPQGEHELKETWKLQEAEYPKITEDDQFIAETLYVSVDPYLSNTIKTTGVIQKELGTVQSSYTIAKVLESKNTAFPVGTVFNAPTNPWKRFFLLNAKNIGYVKILKKPDEPENSFDRLGYQSGLGAFGMPAQTAYYGSFEVGKFKESDVLVVSGAAGAVGTVVGQIAKHVIKCKKVIGIAGGKEKCDYVVKELGFDACIDYKVKLNTKFWKRKSEQFLLEICVLEGRNKIKINKTHLLLENISFGRAKKYTFA
eukprot:Phypoly_transcript_10385.p1 GENE.Phypoly_transcript_10385~~Phypoly_transcript_10385.p1  ORF type:complete len:265 (+),score=52.00 Phypoly_transcript_10385:65-859(+)